MARQDENAFLVYMDNIHKFVGMMEGLNTEEEAARREQEAAERAEENERQSKINAILGGGGIAPGSKEANAIAEARMRVTASEKVQMARFDKLPPDLRIGALRHITELLAKPEPLTSIAFPFPQEVTGDDLLAIALSLDSFPVLSSLDLRGCDIGALGGAAIARMLTEPWKLKNLSIGGSRFTNDGIEMIFQALANSKCPLESLSVDYSFMPMGDMKDFHSSDFIGHCLAKNECIRILELSGHILTTSAVRYLSEAIRKHPQLEKIRLEADGIKDEGMLELSNAIENNAGQLKYVDLSSNSPSTGGGNVLLSSVVRKGCSIEHCYMRNTGISSVNSDVLAHFQFSKMLRVLDLSGCRLTYIGTLGAVLIKNRALQRLYLNNNLIGDEGMQWAHLLSKNDTLQVLQLSNNRITDVGAKHFIIGLQRAARFANGTLRELASKSFIFQTGDKPPTWYTQYMVQVFEDFREEDFEAAVAEDNKRKKERDSQLGFGVLRLSKSVLAELQLDGNKIDPDLLTAMEHLINGGWKEAHKFIEQYRERHRRHYVAEAAAIAKAQAGKTMEKVATRRKELKEKTRLRLIAALEAAEILDGFTNQYLRTQEERDELDRKMEMEQLAFMEKRRLQEEMEEKIKKEQEEAKRAAEERRQDAIAAGEEYNEEEEEEGDDDDDHRYDLEEAKEEEEEKQGFLERLLAVKEKEPMTAVEYSKLLEELREKSKNPSYTVKHLGDDLVPTLKRKTLTSVQMEYLLRGLSGDALRVKLVKTLLPNVSDQENLSGIRRQFLEDESRHAALASVMLTEKVPWEEGPALYYVRSRIGGHPATAYRFTEACKKLDPTDSGYLAHRTFLQILLEPPMHCRAMHATVATTALPHDRQGRVNYKEFIRSCGVLERKKEKGKGHVEIR